MNTNNLKWDQLLRFRLIEIISLWEGRLTTNHLCKAFQIGRQQASRDINKYQHLFDTPPLVLDRHIKGYRPTDSFSPAFSKGSVSEYLSILQQQSEMTDTFELLGLGGMDVELIHAPDRAIAPVVLRNLLLAAREQRRVDIDYASLSSPSVEGRNIVPHTIVNDGIRWHVRAYCEKWRESRDFVISRIRNIPEVLDKSKFGKDNDSDWNDILTFEVTPNKYLNKHQRSVIEHDYSMIDGKLTITSRKALIQYFLKKLDICLNEELLQSQPLEYQLTIRAQEEILPYLFSNKSKSTPINSSPLPNSEY